LEQYTADIGNQALHLFPIRAALRFWPCSQVEWLGDAAFYGRNPSYGAAVHYYVGPGAKEPGKIVISDSQGKVVRTLEGMRDLEGGEEEPEAQASATPLSTSQEPERQQARPEAQESRPTTTPPATQAQQQVAVKAPGAGAEAEEEQPKQAPWVPVEPGLHRVFWDLRAQGPVRWEHAKEFMKGPKTGPLVPPGDYTATITAAGQTLTQKFQVVNDPRSHVSAADLQAQYDMAQSAIHELSQLDTALNRLDAMRAQVNALQQAVKGTPDEQAVKNAADAFFKQLNGVQEKITSNPQAEESTLRKPLALREYVGGLNRLLEDSDQAPTKAVLEEKQRVDADYNAALQAFNTFESSAVTAFNQAMSERKLPAIVSGGTIEP
jgi:hypothetical protein